MPVHNVALVENLLLGIDVLETDSVAIQTLNGLGTWVDLRTILHEGIQTIDVKGRHPLRKGQIHGNLHGHTELPHRDIRIWRNNRTCREFNTFALKIVANTTLLGSQALLKGLKRATRALR